MTNLDCNIVDIPHDGGTGRVNGHAPNAEVVDSERLFVNGIFGHVCFRVPVSALKGGLGSLGLKCEIQLRGGGGGHLLMHLSSTGSREALTPVSVGCCNDFLPG